MIYEEILKAFAAEEEKGIPPTMAYMARCAIDNFDIEKKDVELFVDFVYKAWLKDDTDLSIDTLVRKASTLVKEKGMSFIEGVSPREFLCTCCY